MNNRVRNRLATWGTLGLVVSLQLVPLGVGTYLNTKWKDLGEGFSAIDLGNQRKVYIGNTFGQARVCIDENKDGTLDAVMVNFPISPMMGGPGYRLMKVETTEEDHRKFERANYLLSLK